MTEKRSYVGLKGLAGEECISLALMHSDHHGFSGKSHTLLRDCAHDSD